MTAARSITGGKGSCIWYFIHVTGFPRTGIVAAHCLASRVADHTKHIYTQATQQLSPLLLAPRLARFVHLFEIWTASLQYMFLPGINATPASLHQENSARAILCWGSWSRSSCYPAPFRDSCDPVHHLLHGPVDT